jgi:GDPmannose 4,6-dehydratase
LHASNGILSQPRIPRRAKLLSRAKSPVPLPISRPAFQDKLFLGNLDSPRLGVREGIRRSHVADVTPEKPDDYVIATNETHSIREFLDVTFGHVGLDWKKYVEIDPRYFRPAEVDLLIGDYSKARKQLGWEPNTRFVALAKLMVDADVELLRKHRQGRSSS